MFYADYVITITVIIIIVHGNVPWLAECLNSLFPHLPVLRYPLLDGTFLVVV